MDLGRSSHIHITTWGTLSRQKKGQRSKGTEGASIISLSIALSNKFAFNICRFCLSCCVYSHFLLCSCSTLSDFLSFFFLFLFFFSLEAWRRSPPAATEDNYTNTDKSASTVTHSRVGVLPYATSYHLQRLCKKGKGKLVSQELDTRVNGVPRAGETRDDGKRKEDQITSPTEPPTSTH